MEQEALQKLNECLEKLREVKAMDFWAYTREHELGQLDIAEYAIQSVVNALQY